ncbi:MAG: TlpA disulfide reductase family protein [Acidimicrobiia bacterium]|nr:TlpA disulfide reductase family protein [Acidimicrobiia bacterium]
MRRSLGTALLVFVLAACGGKTVDISRVPELPEISVDELSGVLAGSAQPVVLNVWASWCVPCRSEAPLLEKAATTTDDVTFIGLNVRDDQTGARSFIAEFFPEAPIDHYRDPGGDIPVGLGGNRGVPLTYFFAPHGELIELHSGVIDERTLALQIDEISSR